MNESIYERLLEWGRPRSFSGLMSLYESSYQRLVQLAPEIDLPFERAVSRCDRDADLHLRVLSRCKYTSDVHLTYWFSVASGVEAHPDLVVRIYHDAGLAEALHCGPKLRTVLSRDLSPQARQYVCRRWGRNLLLNKWLEYCLSHGHGFVLAERPRYGAAKGGLAWC